MSCDNCNIDNNTIENENIISLIVNDRIKQSYNRTRLILKLTNENLQLKLQLQQFKNQNTTTIKLILKMKIKCKGFNVSLILLLLMSSMLSSNNSNIDVELISYLVESVIVLSANAQASLSRVRRNKHC
ncbi:hypothetical protein ACTFIY_010595 [Dictyostelium cf. discoideum]